MHWAERVAVATSDAPPVTGAAAEVAAALFATQPTAMIVSPHFFQMLLTICAGDLQFCALAVSAGTVLSVRASKLIMRIFFFMVVTPFKFVRVGLSIQIPFGANSLLC